MNRRQLVQGSAVLPALLLASQSGFAAARPSDEAFGPSTVRDLARMLAGKTYEAPDERLPSGLNDLDYDQYRSIRFLPERALWRGKSLPFEAQFFHRGFFYKNRVNIFEVADGKATELKYRKADFSFGAKVPAFDDVDLGFAGFRVHAPMNRADYYDEVCVFLGASYFRAVAKGQTYGLSARGLSIDTGEAKGEEFPLFKAFWLERPAPGSTSLVIHALLDSKSCAASYRFTVRPGETTVFDVEMSVYPRAEMQRAGLAPMTSMFFYGPNDRNDIDDFRPSVHDSDGLAIFNGKGESLWRPLSNPRDLQISTFQDLNPRGFGLMQRERNFFAYQDMNQVSRNDPVSGWSRSRTGARAASRCSRSQLRRRSTTTSPLSGGPRTRCRPRANTTTPIGCTGDRTARRSIRSPVSPVQASGPGAKTTASSSSTWSART